MRSGSSPSAAVGAAVRGATKETTWADKSRRPPPDRSSAATIVARTPGPAAVPRPRRCGSDAGGSLRPPPTPGPLDRFLVGCRGAAGARSGAVGGEAQVGDARRATAASTGAGAAIDSPGPGRRTPRLAVWEREPAGMVTRRRGDAATGISPPRSSVWVKYRWAIRSIISGWSSSGRSSNRQMEMRILQTAAGEVGAQVAVTELPADCGAGARRHRGPGGRRCARTPGAAPRRRRRR